MMCRGVGCEQCAGVVWYLRGVFDGQGFAGLPGAVCRGDLGLAAAINARGRIASSFKCRQASRTLD